MKKCKFVALIVIILVLLLSQFTVLQFGFVSTVKAFPISGVEDSEIDLVAGKLTIFKWNREVSFSIKYVEETLSYTFIPDGVQFSYSDFDLKIYNTTVNGEPVIEYEPILNAKPSTNVLTFSIEFRNLVFYYQPPLDQELNVAEYDFVNATHAIKDGEVVEHRPENIVGSYAVYHESKRDNEYKTGKAFHIYRPKLTDVYGGESWANMSIISDTLTMTLSQEFLNNAVYPVTIDPTFGYTTKGGASTTLANYIKGSWATGVAGTAQSITAYLMYSAASNIKYALYTKTGSLTGSKVEQTEAWALTSGWDNWKTLNLVTNQTISAVDYWLFLWHGGATYVYRDSAASGKSGYYSSSYTGTYPATISLTAQSYIYSIYCNYTVGYELNLRVMDWDLIDAIANAQVCMNNSTDYWKTSDSNGWANYTGVSGTVTVKVQYYGFWVNGTFPVTMDSDKTIDVQCKLYDVTVLVQEGVQNAYLVGANVTVYNSTSVQGNKITSGVTGNNGQVQLLNLPNNTLTFTQYGGASYSLVIGNTTQLVSSENQTITLTANQNNVSTSNTYSIIAFAGMTIPLEGGFVTKRLKRKMYKKRKRAEINEGSQEEVIF
jgi:hypothetical protein